MAAQRANCSLPKSAVQETQAAFSVDVDHARCCPFFGKFLLLIKGEHDPKQKGQQLPKPTAVAGIGTGPVAHPGFYIICIMRNKRLGWLARVWRYYLSLLRLALDRLLPLKRVPFPATEAQA